MIYKMFLSKQKRIIKGLYINACCGLKIKDILSDTKTIPASKINNYGKEWIKFIEGHII
jgi:hypothetical protein